MHVNITLGNSGSNLKMPIVESTGTSTEVKIEGYAKFVGVEFFFIPSPKRMKKEALRRGAT